jgi:hypothetical protein
MKTADILELLTARYKPPEWAFFKELRTGTGYNWSGYVQGNRVNKNVERRLDAFAFHLWPSGGYRPTGFEVKVSRSDFLHDLKQPAKRARYLALCQYFYYVVPSGLVQPEEVPEEAGLLWVYESGRIKTVKYPPLRDIPLPEWDFFAAICRRCSGAKRVY